MKDEACAALSRDLLVAAERLITLRNRRFLRNLGSHACSLSRFSSGRRSLISARKVSSSFRGPNSLASCGGHRRRARPNLSISFFSTADCHVRDVVELMTPTLRNLLSDFESVTIFAGNTRLILEMCIFSAQQMRDNLLIATFSGELFQGGFSPRRNP